MYVTVCNRRLPVVIGNDLQTSEGELTYELFRPSSMDIAIDVTTPPDRRRFYLIHAIGHAYDHLVGLLDPGDNEGRQNRGATIDAQLAADLRDQGGETVLHAMFGDHEIPMPEHVPGDPIYVPVEDEGTEHPLDLWCPGCREPHKWSAARKGRPRFCPRIGGYAIRVSLACSCCSREWTWMQRCSDTGTPWPAMVASATLTRNLNPARN